MRRSTTTRSHRAGFCQTACLIASTLTVGSAVAGEQVFYQTVGPSGEAVFSDEAVEGSLPHIVLYDSPSTAAVEEARATTREQLEIAETLEDSRLARDETREEARARVRTEQQIARSAQPVYVDDEPRYYPVYGHSDRHYRRNHRYTHRYDRWRSHRGAGHRDRPYDGGRPRGGVVERPEPSWQVHLKP